MLHLATANEATAIYSMLEGMLDLLVDDGLTEDADNMRGVMRWLAAATPETTAYPLALPLPLEELSSTEIALLRAAIGNVADQGDTWGDGDGEEKFTASIEESRRQLIERHENVSCDHFAAEGWDSAKEYLIDYLRSRQDVAMQDLDHAVRTRDLRAYELEILITALEAQQPVTMIGSIHREHREKSNEFFYTDESGRKRDLLLHADVLAEGEDAASFAKSLYPALRAQGYSDEDIRQALPELYDEMVARGLKPHERSGR